MFTRRDFGKVALAGVPLVRGWAAGNLTINGVRIGVQSSSFTGSGMPIDAIIKMVTGLGFTEIGVMSQHIENYLGAPVELPGGARRVPGAATQQQASNGAGGAGAARRGSGGAGRGGGDSAARAALRAWRLETGLDKYRAVGEQFKHANLRLFCYGLSFDETFTDEEIDKGMLSAPVRRR